MRLGTRDHTTLTAGNFASFSVLMFGLGVLSVGFGLVDMAMTAPLGLVYVAGLAVGESVIQVLNAFFIGFVDVMTARLARAEGSGRSEDEFGAVFVAFGIVLLILEAVSIVFGAICWFVLPLLVADPDVAGAAREYVVIRCFGVAILLGMSAVRETLKVIGARSSSIAVFGIGLGVNAALNAVLLYAVPGTLGSPMYSVALATVLAQVIMAVIGIRVVRRQVADRNFRRPGRDEVRGQLGTMLGRGAGIGVRHMNDYAGGTIPLVMAGTLGVQSVAAIGVASSIWTLFCRVPQACFNAAFIYYGYAVDKGAEITAEFRRKVTRYSAVPTIVAVAVCLLLSPLLVLLFGGGQVPMKTALLMVGAFFILVIPYFFEGLNGELLSAHEDGGFLSVSSTVATWLGNIPLAAAGIYLLHSGFWAYALAVIPTIGLATAFTRRLNRLSRVPQT
ncbi:hypothetical protein GCM10009554_61960 [Kribbella koreensis]|uniref:Probable multidrug resistance protein NorM n=1 Tax=Kribbella koreensis TaxID=57909 RepID=A0ABN1RCV9_9ACTN